MVEVVVERVTVGRGWAVVVEGRAVEVLVRFQYGMAVVFGGAGIFQGGVGVDGGRDGSVTVSVGS